MAEQAEEKRGNVLLAEAPGALPAFDAIRPEDVVPGIRAVLEILEREFEALEQSVEPTWAGLVEPLERLSDRLERSW